MPRPLRTSEIHEFAEVGRIPEDAVTDEILRNVAELDERKQLEVWIQEIIHSSDNTPHTSTEIVDIISTKVTVNGSPTFAAFILKGKSSKKITSKNVSHQIIRLRRLTGLELAVFAAAGDIHDDVYEQLAYEAKSLGCNYLVMTSHDLARLFIAYDKICWQDGLPFEEGVCPNGHSQRQELVLNYKVREDARWEVFRLKDLSHGLAKRLSATILTDRHYPEDVLRTIIVEVFQEVRTDPYLRSEMVRARWGDTPAHVVWIDIGFEIEDINRCNWVCMACWIDPDLDENSRPLWTHVDEDFSGIMIDWNSNYHAMKKLLSEHTGKKYEVIQCVEKILKELQPIGYLLEHTFAEFQRGAIEEQSLIEVIRKNENHAWDIYNLGTKCPLAPPECMDYRQQFMDAISFFHNLFLFHSTEDLQKRTVENRTWLFGRQLSYMKDALRKLGYEREKL